MWYLVLVNSYLDDNRGETSHRLSIREGRWLFRKQVALHLKADYFKGIEWWRDEADKTKNY